MLSFLRPYLFWARCRTCERQLLRSARRALRSRLRVFASAGTAEECSARAFSTTPTRKAKRFMPHLLSNATSQFLKAPPPPPPPPPRSPPAGKPTGWSISTDKRPTLLDEEKGNVLQGQRDQQIFNTSSYEERETRLGTGSRENLIPSVRSPIEQALQSYIANSPPVEELENFEDEVQPGPSETDIERLQKSAKQMRQLLEAFFPSTKTSNGNGNGNRNGNGNGNGTKKVPWIDVSEEVRKSVENKPQVELSKLENVRQVFARTPKQPGSAQEDKDKYLDKKNPQSQSVTIFSNIGNTMLASDISRIAYHLNKQGLGRSITRILPIFDPLSFRRRPAYAIHLESHSSSIDAIYKQIQGMMDAIYSQSTINPELTLPPTVEPRCFFKRARKYGSPKEFYEGGSAPDRCVRLVMSGCPRPILAKMLQDKIIRAPGMSQKLLNGVFELGRSCVDIIGYTKQKPNQAAWLLRFGQGYESEAVRIEREWHQKEILLPIRGEGNTARNYTVRVQAEVTRW